MKDLRDESLRNVVSKGSDDSPFVIPGQQGGLVNPVVVPDLHVYLLISPVHQIPSHCKLQNLLPVTQVKQLLHCSCFFTLMQTAALKGSLMDSSLEAL